MLWWGGHGWWGPGWWWPGIVVMVVFMAICAAIALRMMRGMGMCGMGRSAPNRDRQAAAEELLAGRLARGEIDVDEYHRRREALDATNTRASIGRVPLDG